MSQYSRPTEAEIVERYTLRPSMMGVDMGDIDAEDQLLALLTPLLVDAEDAMVAHVGETIAESADLTDRQARQLEQAVRLRVVGAVESVLAGLVMAGEHEALLVGDPDTLRRQSLEREAKAEELEGAVAAAVEQAGADSDSTPATAWGMFRSSTFTPSRTVRPSERIRALDERDDLEAVGEATLLP